MITFPAGNLYLDSTPQSNSRTDSLPFKSGAVTPSASSLSSLPQVSDSDGFSFFTDELDPFSDDLLTYAVNDNRAQWSVSWSDIMMTMFIFFAVLYIYKSGNRELQFGQGPGEENISDGGSGVIMEKNLEHKPSEIYDQARNALVDKWVNESISVDLLKDKAIRITLSSDLFFDTGKADLKTEAIWELRQVAEILRKNSFIINVVGHTDSVPNHSVLFPTNWELSTARACRVARFLIEEEKIEEGRFFISGHSWHQPVATNTSAYNRSLNRRVELLLMKEMPYQVSELSGSASSSLSGAAATAQPPIVPSSTASSPPIVSEPVSP